MKKAHLLHEPEEKTITFMGKTATADVVVTTSLAEAAYYLTGSIEVRSYSRVDEGIYTVILEDEGGRVLRERYKAYRNNEYFPDIQDFFSWYRFLENQYRQALKSKEVKL